ncbi:hypothetical protein [Methylobacterium radiotolerans]|uniref:hypothetical protein n=1 Tax=Methylobacterium radiotolerans TaxID=31998 RepID=UPI0015F3C2D7|nr:hypothetical protein [Methylobacterium radiotolerans]
MQIDIRVASVPTKTKIWRLFPGEGYAFLNDFRTENVGFLDYPGIILPDRPLKFWNEFDENIIKSDVLSRFLRENGPNSRIKFDDIDTSANRWSERRTRDKNSLINLFEEARKGDLVVLPEQKWMGKIWIGQLKSNRVVYSRSPKRYGEYQIPAREIAWSRGFPERMVSRALSDSLRQVHPFALVEQSLYFELFSLYFDSYVFKDRNASTIFNGEEFLDADASLLSNITKIAAAACIAIDYEDDGRSPLYEDLLGTILTNPPIEYTCSQESDIHSEGFTRLTSARLVPLVTSSLLASLILLSGCKDKKEMKSELGKIEYVNSSPYSDPACNARVSRASALALSFIGIDKTWEICKSARESAARDIRPSARPHVRPHSK